MKRCEDNIPSWHSISVELLLRPWYETGYENGITAENAAIVYKWLTAWKIIKHNDRTFTKAQSPAYL